MNKKNKVPMGDVNKLTKRPGAKQMPAKKKAPSKC